MMGDYRLVKLVHTETYFDFDIVAYLDYDGGLTVHIKERQSAVLLQETDNVLKARRWIDDLVEQAVNQTEITVDNELSS